MERLTEECWRNLEPWECCGQDKYCQRGCHDEGGCTNGCKVPKLYIKLAKYEDLEEKCVKDNLFGLHELCEKWKEFSEEIAELLDYRKKQEQGMLIELPCKVGSKVFLICSRYTKCTEHGVEFDDYSCEGCECLECDSRREYYIHENHSVSLEWIVRYLNDFGVRVFLTRSEAEEAQAKIGGKA